MSAALRFFFLLPRRCRNLVKHKKAGILRLCVQKRGGYGFPYSNTTLLVVYQNWRQITYYSV